MSDEILIDTANAVYVPSQATASREIGVEAPAGEVMSQHPAKASTPTGDVLGSRPKRGVALGLVGLLWLLHVVMNWLWLHANVTILGWDQPAHLVRSLEYLRLLQPFSIGALFDALTWHSFYPPLFHLSVVGFYSLFGVSADVAAMTNVLYLAVLLFSVYGIGECIYDEATGLLAAGLVSLFPIVFFMSRSTYIDFTLMSMVALSVFLLLKTDRFRERGWSYALGASLGLGLLAKWIFVVFAVPPCLYVFLASPAFHDLRDILKPVRPQWRRLGLAAVSGFAGAGLWYVASGSWETKVAFGLPLAILYWMLLSVLVYVGSLPGRPLNNLVGAITLTLGIAAIWYIPNSDFITTALYKAYHFGSETKPVVSQNGGLLPAWLYYIRGTVNEHLSAPIALTVFGLVVVWLARRLRKAWPLPAQVWVLGLWFIVPFAFFASFSNSSSWSMRFTISLLPPVAIVLARTSLRVKRSWVRYGLAIILLLVAFAQWMVLSLDALAWLPERTGLQLPGWGRLNWFAQGEFVQWPDAGLTGHRYWVAPLVFQRILQERDPALSRSTSAGLLVNQSYLNGYQATYVANTDYPFVEVIDLFRNRKGLPVYPQLFGLDYVVVSDSEVENLNAGDQSTRLVTAILTHPPKAFSQSFREIATFETPNKDVIHLYKNETYEPPKLVPPELMPGAAEDVVNLNFGKQLLLMSYEINQDRLAQSGKLGIDLYWLGLQKMDEDYVVVLKLVNGIYQVWGKQEGRPAWGSFSTQDWAKGQVVPDSREIAILPGTPPGSYRIEVAIYGLHEGHELSLMEKKEAFLGPVAISRQLPPPLERLDIQNRLGKDLGGKVRLLGYNIESGFKPGDNLHLTLFWQALKTIDNSYTVFNHLIGPDGKVWAQKDNPPAGGFYPTTSWASGEIIRDQYDLPIALDAPAGAYTLQSGMYLPQTGQRLPVLGADGRVENDHFTLEGLPIGPK